jgi:hypothetical protein
VATVPPPGASAISERLFAIEISILSSGAIDVPFEGKARSRSTQENLSPHVSVRIGLRISPHLL